jgi:zinc protease
LIKKTSDDPASFIGMVQAQYLFGDHAYGRETFGTAKSVRAIQRKDIIKHYKKFFRPNNTTLAVIGNYTDDIAKILEEKFKDWTPLEVQKEGYGIPPEIKDIQIRIIDNPILNQAQIRIGHLGIKRSDDDFIRIRLANTVLGSGFVSRLMDRIRDNLGLTYSISSSFDSRVDRGPFTISSFTKIDTIGKLVEETLKLYKDFAEKGITAQELSTTKSYLLGVFPQAIDTKEKLAFNLLILKRHGISYDYLKKYPANISNLSLSEVNAAIKKHFQPNDLKIVVYAPAAKAKPQLSKIGKVEVVDYRKYQ